MENKAIRERERERLLVAREQAMEDFQHMMDSTGLHHIADHIHPDNSFRGGLFNK